jgi:hypothetical protein
MGQAVCSCSALPVRNRTRFKVAGVGVPGRFQTMDLSKVVPKRERIALLMALGSRGQASAIRAKSSACSPSNTKPGTKPVP